MPIETLADADALEDCVGRRPVVFHLKSISFLDEHCRALLAASPFAVVGAVAGDGALRTFAVGGDPGVLAVTGRASLALPTLAGLDLPDGAAVGLLTFVPGYRETLRVNGRLRTGATPSIEVGEAFLHCAKALIRSGMWKEPASPALPGLAEGTADLSTPGVAAFLEACPFVALSSVDAGDEADVSPKGDPAGFVAQVVDDHTLAIADRPGNGRTDTMHNLVSRDTMGLLAMIPGDERVVEVRGRGAVTADEGVRAGLAVAGKVPKAAIVLSVEHLEVRREPAIAAARLWDTTRHVDSATMPKSTRIWVDHCKLNDDKGMAVAAARKMLNVKMMNAGIDRDYANNLY
ncbi:MAG: pyridoxamine 5'-phosphate oxidase family protein [Ilumatobacteraceae bacterium]